jgi:hypothetical protein
MEKFLTLMADLVGPIFAALVGTLTRHTHLSSKYGLPMNWSRVALDTPSVLLMGIIGGAMGQYTHDHYSTPELFTWGLAAAFGYTGPTIVDTIMDVLHRKIIGDKPDDKGGPEKPGD